MISMTILKYDEVIKKYVLWLLFWYFLKDLTLEVLPHSCKISWPGLNCFRIYDGESFRPLKLFNVKKPRICCKKKLKTAGNVLSIFVEVNVLYLQNMSNCSTFFYVSFFIVLFGRFFTYSLKHLRSHAA